MSFDLAQHLFTTQILEEVAFGMLLDPELSDNPHINLAIKETGKIHSIFQNGDKVRVVLSYAGAYCRIEVIIDLPFSEVEANVLKKLEEQHAA